MGLKAIVSHFMDCFDDAFASIHWHWYWVCELGIAVLIVPIHIQDTINLDAPFSQEVGHHRPFLWLLEGKDKLLKNLRVINHLTCLGFRSIKFLVSKKATLACACKHCDTKRVIVLYWMYYKTSTTITSIVDPVQVVWKEEIAKKNGFLFSKFSFKSLAVWNRQKRPQSVKNRGVDSFVLFNQTYISF